MKTGARYRNALERNLAELNNCVLKRRAYNALVEAKSRHSLDFFRISANALSNDIYTHAHRVFDRHKGAASFWYIQRVAPKAVADAAKAAGISLADIGRIAAKTKHLRDKTHFHIDKEQVGRASRVWEGAQLTGNEFITLTEGTHEILRRVYRDLTGVDTVIPDYHGKDVKPIIRAYKKAHPHAPIAL